MIIAYILLFSMFIIILLASIGLLQDNSNELSDYDLYGMDSEDYLKKQVGENYYNKYYKK